MVDPDIRRLLDTVFNAPQGAAPPDVAQVRAAAEKVPALLGGEPLATESIIDAHAPGDAASVPVRIYRPAAHPPLPLVLYAHGGGWVTGSLESHDRLCRILAARLQAVVVAVDYRCAPEHVFPAALDDVAAAWQWARTNAQIGRAHV
jgi:acetyl esterase